MSDPSPAYRVDFRIDDRDPLQQRLNGLYDYVADVPTKVLHRSRLNLFYVTMRELVDGGLVRRFDTAVDVGCNAGMYSALLSDFGFRDVLGIDVVPSMIERARATFERDEPGRRIRFRCEGVEALPESPAFDFLLCTEVIEHTEHPLDTIRRLAATLIPGGLAIVSLPNVLSMPFQIAVAIHRLKRKPWDAVFEEHLRYPFHRSLELFRAQGLEVVRTTATNLFFDDHVLALTYARPGFSTLNRLNFELSRRAPFKYVSQFFFMVLRKPVAAGGPA